MKKQTTETDDAAIAGSNMLAADLSKLKTKLKKVEKELSKCKKQRDNALVTIQDLKDKGN